MAKKKTQKTPAKTETAAKGSAQDRPEDTMSQVALLCQEQKWREAARLIRVTCEKARKGGKGDLVAGLEMALKKIEYSLRRQMAAAVTKRTQEFVRKEYLLDVGK